MNTIELLMAEHRRIERGLDALQVWAQLVASGDTSAQDDAGRFVDFIGRYADAHHHGKEEKLLFEALAEAGLPWEAGPLAVMMLEHDEGRALMAVIRDAMATHTPWPADLAHQAAQAGQSFAALLRNHIFKEDNVLYPMALEALDDEVWAELDAACNEHEDDNGAERARLEHLGEELARRYLEPGVGSRPVSVA